MSSFWNTPFIVVDVETTGSSAEKNRITDIACVTVQGGRIISEYNSLVNPHQFIPPFIQKMTHISQAMVVNAPEAVEVFDKVSDIFSNDQAVFVAHNAGFDQGFVDTTLKREGYRGLDRPVLCTLKLARRLLSVKLKKNLGDLSGHFDIKIRNRHRAMGDAKATALVLIELMEIVERDHNIHTTEELLQFQNKAVKHFRAPSQTYTRLENKLSSLPDEPGVYYYKDIDDNILYIGKAKSLRKRVNTYFAPNSFTSRKISNMLKKVHNIDWECTDTELAALIEESRQIKLHKPQFNTVDKKYRQYPFIKIDPAELFPIPRIVWYVDPDGADYYGPFRSEYLAADIIDTIRKKFSIRKCEKEKPGNGTGRPCFYFHLKQCFAPCQNPVDKEYKFELQKVHSFLSGFAGSIIEQLREQMQELAENLEFEKADRIKRTITDLSKVFDRQQKVPTSINQNNMIMVLPASVREKTVEIFFIKRGKLSAQRTLGRKAPIDPMADLLHDIYFNGNSDSPEPLDERDIDELRIITSWVYRKQGTAQCIYLNNTNEDTALKDLKSSIRNIEYEKDESED